MIPFLEENYFVAVLDFPGFGFSDKPQDGYSYMLEDTRSSSITSFRTSWDCLGSIS